MRVAVTGAAGYIGRRLVAELVSRDVDVVAIDLTAPTEALLAPRTTFRQVDVRDDRFVEVLDGVDVVVHLAFVFNPSRDEAHMRDANVEGTRNLFEAAAKAGCRKIVYTSAATVYGARPDNDFPLTEASPLRANIDFNYAEHKLDIERWLATWVEQHPSIAVTILRPATVVGAGLENFITRQLEMPRLPTVRGYRPPWQVAHVDDVVAALTLTVERDLPGPYNVACEGWLSFEEVRRLTRMAPLELPEQVAFSLTDRLWQLGVGEAPPGQLHYLMHPTVMSVDKLVAAGWTPRHSNRDALMEVVAEHRSYVNLGVTRVRRRAIGVAAAAAGGLVSASAVRRIRRRRRSPPLPGHGDV